MSSRRGGFAFAALANSSENSSRIGRFDTPHGPVSTPAFMPVGTRGTVKGVRPDELLALGSRMILANTYHLHLRPGESIVHELGGLHRFMNWDGPILTDSGGYQVFSLSTLNKIDDDGVDFQSVVDGAHIRFTPERVVDIQRALGADVTMALDHCPDDPLDRAKVAIATERTHRWLERAVARHRELGGDESGQALFGIVQGGAFDDLRRASVDAVCAHDLVGYAIGGVSVGEDREQMRVAIDSAAPRLPADRPRYLMGVGTPIDFVEAVARGIDLFDCVTPTRHGRTAQAFTSQGLVNISNARFARDERALDPNCDCPACRGFSRGVLRHLAKSNEMLGAMLLTQHNIRFFHALFERMRHAIEHGGWSELEREVRACHGSVLAQDE